MAAAVERRLTNSRGELRGVKVIMPENTTIFEGTMVMRNANGNGVPAAADANNKGVAGVSKEDHVTGAGETKEIVVYEGEFDFTAIGPITQANEGDIAYADTDQEIAAAAGVNRPRAGRITEFVSGTRCWVRVGAAMLA